MGQEFVRDLEPGLPPREDGVAELQRVPVDDDRGQQVEAGDPVVLPLPGSVPQLAALVEVDGTLEGVVRFALVQADQNRERSMRPTSRSAAASIGQLPEDVFEPSSSCRGFQRVERAVRNDPWLQRSGSRLLSLPVNPVARCRGPVP